MICFDNLRNKAQCCQKCIENHLKRASIQTKEGNLEEFHIDPIAIEGYFSQKFNLHEARKEKEITDKDDIDELD